MKTTGDMTLAELNNRIKWKTMNKLRFKFLLFTIIALFSFVISTCNCAFAKNNLTTKEIKNRYWKAIVGIYTVETNKGKSDYYQGTGFVVKSDGVIVTNYHVVDTGNILVKYYDETYDNDVKVIWYNEEIDIALLQVSRHNLPTVVLGDSKRVETGDEVTVIGNPEGLDYTVSNGIVSNILKFDNSQIIQITAPISHGSSGSPVFDSKGNVICVVSSFMKEGQLLNFSVPINYIASPLAEYKNTVKLNSLQQEFNNYILWGSTNFKKGNYKEATKLFSHAIEIAPYSILGYDWRAAVYMRLKDYDKAVSDYDKSYQIQKASGFIYLYSFVNSNECAEIIKVYDALIARHSNDDLLYGTRGTAYQIDCHNRELAEIDFGTAISLEPNNYRYYYQRGNIYYYENKYNDALNDLNTAIRLKYDCIECHDSRANILSEIGDYYRADKDVGAGLKIIEDWTESNLDWKCIYSGNLRVTKIKLFVKRGDFQQALDYIDSELKSNDICKEHFSWEINNEKGKVYFEKANMLKTTGAYRDAITYYEKADSYKACDSCYEQKGFCYFELKDYDSAINEFRNIEYDTTKTAISHLYMLQGKTEKAAQLLNEIVDKDGFSFAYIERAQLFTTTGRYFEAIDDYQMAINKMGDKEVEGSIGAYKPLIAAFIFKSMGDLYRKLDRVKEAKEVYKKAIEILGKIDVVDKDRENKEENLEYYDLLNMSQFPMYNYEIKEMKDFVDKN